MGLRIGLGDVADDLRRGYAVGQERERHRRVVAGLNVEPGIVDRIAVESRRGAGLQPAEREAAAPQGLRQAIGRRLAHTPRRDLLIADMDQAAEKSAGGQHHPPGGDMPSVAERDAAHPAVVVEQQILSRALDDIETVDLGQQFGHGAAIKLAVGLRPRPAHRRTLRTVQHAELDAGLVDGPAHHPVERVDLAHQMALGEAADCRVARHLADRRPVVRQQSGAGTDAGRCRSRLAASMTTADHEHIVLCPDVIHGGGM